MKVSASDSPKIKIIASAIFCTLHLILIETNPKTFEYNQLHQRNWGIHFGSHCMCVQLGGPRDPRPQLSYMYIFLCTLSVLLIWMKIRI